MTTTDSSAVLPTRRESLSRVILAPLSTPAVLPCSPRSSSTPTSSPSPALLTSDARASLLSILSLPWVLPLLPPSLPLPLSNAQLTAVLSACQGSLDHLLLHLTRLRALPPPPTFDAFLSSLSPSPSAAPTSPLSPPPPTPPHPPPPRSRLPSLSLPSDVVLPLSRSFSSPSSPFTLPAAPRLSLPPLTCGAYTPSTSCTPTMPSTPFHHASTLSTPALSSAPSPSSSSSPFAPLPSLLPSSSSPPSSHSPPSSSLPLPPPPRRTRARSELWGNSSSTSSPSPTTPDATLDTLTQAAYIINGGGVEKGGGKRWLTGGGDVTVAQLLPLLSVGSSAALLAVVRGVGGVGGGGVLPAPLPVGEAGLVVRWLQGRMVRGRLVGMLSFPRCRLFECATAAVVVTGKHLDALQAMGVEEVEREVRRMEGRGVRLEGGVDQLIATLQRTITPHSIREEEDEPPHHPLPTAPTPAPNPPLRRFSVF